MSGQILVVDDARTMRHHVRQLLTAAGYSVAEAVDGYDALARLESTPGIELVITDLNMPRMDGLDFLERVREKPEHKDLRVVIMTTATQMDLVLRGKKLGIGGWLMKPFKPDVLVAAIRKLYEPAA